ncbi:Polysaccharide pyruvyl transferase, partial [human gut metagenome]
GSMEKIILVGASLNSGNRGVNALTRSMIMLILNKYGNNSKITILSYTVKETVENKIYFEDKEIIVEEKLCTRKNMIKTYLLSNIGVENELSKMIKDSDQIWDISEGDSFSDIYGIGRLIQHSLIKLISIKLRKNLVIMPQTIGPFNKKISKVIAKKIINKANIVFVRDDISKKVLQDDLRIKRKINVSPDMAFYMEPKKDASIDKFINENDKIKVGINISALLYNGGYNGKNMFGLKADYSKVIRCIIETFSEKKNVEIILIPHVMVESMEVEDDFRTCNRIADEFRKNKNINIHTLDKYYREDELKSIISGCDFFVGSRMHACIGAISTHVPTVPIAYSRKFIGIWDKIGLGYCVTDPRKQSEDEIISSILENFNNSKKIKEKLDLEIPLLEKQIEKIVDIIEEN